MTTPHGSVVGRPARSNSGATARRRGLTWRVPAALVALSLVPVLAGATRLVQMTGGPELLPARSDPSPVPLVLHIVSVAGYAVLGAFQFSAGLRRRRIGWHRAAGRLLVPLGLVVALSALWMTLFYPRDDGGDVLFVFRLLAGSGMAASLVLGVTAVMRGDIASHRAWMIRAYALALGAGTQVFTLGVGQAVVGAGDLSAALLEGAAWPINLAVAEWVIRRQPARRPARAVVLP